MLHHPQLSWSYINVIHIHLVLTLQLKVIDDQSKHELWTYTLSWII